MRWLPAAQASRWDGCVGHNHVLAAETAAPLEIGESRLVYRYEALPLTMPICACTLSVKPPAHLSVQRHLTESAVVKRNRVHLPLLLRAQKSGK